MGMGGFVAGDSGRALSEGGFVVGDSGRTHGHSARQRWCWGGPGVSSLLATRCYVCLGLFTPALSPFGGRSASSLPPSLCWGGGAAVAIRVPLDTSSTTDTSSTRQCRCRVCAGLGLAGRPVGPRSCNCT